MQKTAQTADSKPTPPKAEVQPKLVVEKKEEVKMKPAEQMVNEKEKPKQEEVKFPVK